ncbi:hypothetical protein BH24CHL4_BH24CHL4_08920 [soil metagenome]
MADQQRNPKVSSARNMLSTLLFVVAAVLVAVAVYFYVQDRRQDDEPPPPPIIAGQAQLANVRDVLVSEGLDVEYGPEGGRIDGFNPPGQQLIVEDESVFVFIFRDPETRQAATTDLDAGDIELTGEFGDPISEEQLRIGQGSNVVTVLAGGNQDLQTSIDAALSTLP